MQSIIRTDCSIVEEEIFTVLAIQWSKAHHALWTTRGIRIEWILDVAVTAKDRRGSWKVL